MLIIGLLGGVASGKSLVARQFGEMGAGVLDADRAGHEVLRLPDVEDEIRNHWGERVFGDDGHVDRARLAAIVFDPSPEGGTARKRLEQITHPRIAQLLSADAEALAAQGFRAVVLDAPLLFEAGWDRLCGTLVFVDAPGPVRLRRALARGWTEQQFAAREAAQETLDLKRQRADYAIDNSGPPEATFAQVERVWRSLIG